MKLSWKIVVGLLALGIACALWFFGTAHDARRALEQTRNSLRQQGFKLDRSEFGFPTSAEMRARGAVIASTVGPRSVWLGMRGDLLSFPGPRSNTVPILWREQYLAAKSSTNLWPELRSAFDASNLIQARDAVLTGPLRFEPGSSAGSRDMMWPHLNRLRTLELALQARLLLDLHDGNFDEAWLDLLASTRLVVDWIPEPAAICHTVRCMLVTAAYDSTWQALQADCWSEAQLAQLQREWEAAEFSKALPSTAAFARANLAASLEDGRQQPLPAAARPPSLWSDPEGFFAAFRDRQRQIHYRRQGSFEDERSMLLFYRDRELELRRAVMCSTWQEVRALPVVTNFPAFGRQGPRGGGFRQGGFGGSGRRLGLLARAADSEARRRILVTALSLERYHRQHGAYPKALDALVPGFLTSVPIDFMDGKPLRYCSTEDGHYVLYSVGLDCADNGGNPSFSQPGAEIPEGPVPLDYQEGTDLVWPRPIVLNQLEVQITN